MSKSGLYRDDSTGDVDAAGVPIDLGGAPNRLTPAQITADQNDYAPTGWGDTVTAASFDLDAARAITGFVATGITDGREITLVNKSAFNLTLKHQNAGSTAANRIHVPGLIDLVLAPNDSARIMYDADLVAWRIV